MAPRRKRAASEEPAARMLALARTIDPARVEGLSERGSAALAVGSLAHAVATLLATAYPALAPVLEAFPELPRAIAAEGHHAERDRVSLRARVLARVGEALDDPERVQRELRRAARDERVRIALRELLPLSLGGADVDVTARELAALADVTIDVALADAARAVASRFGPPLAASGAPARFVVLGMGKLGGEELNAGSDVDLLYFYDTDDGAAVAADGAAISLHDFWTRVARRLTATLEQATGDGFVWRVDLRLRPEGKSGPLVNSLGAAERYYESFGRLWERAALVRARPVAGDLGFGAEVLAALAPFVWRRRVDPAIAVEMVQLAERSRVELSVDPARDLKLGPGGIREAEFFVQTLELVWGGREPRVRARGTLDALRRLRSAGLVTDREGRELAEGYLALRRAEHAVQVATGQQTHVRPEGGPDLERLARALGFPDGAAFLEGTTAHMRRIGARLASLLPGGGTARDGARGARWLEAVAALERNLLEPFTDAIRKAFAAASPGPRATGGASDPGEDRWGDVGRDLFELSRHPDAPLGARSRETFPQLTEAVLDAVLDASDPEQAARYLRTFFARLGQPGVYVRLLGASPHPIRRLVEVLGASAFIAEAITKNPELGDLVLWNRTHPTPDRAREEVATAVAASLDTAREGPGAEDPDEPLVAALRTAKARFTVEVGLADLESEVTVREATLGLSALADASLEAAVRHALGTGPGEGVRGLAVVAMGKLGGREIGYGSDLDVIFFFDPGAAPAGRDPDAFFARCARRVIRLVSISHPAGSGYELDTRLRPSGSQGLLVTSLDAFARYHGIGAEVGPGPRPAAGARAAVWERLALLRARAAAGDPALGAEAIRLAHAAAYDLPGDPAAAAQEIHRLRLRMERESSLEREGRYDLKLGRGGLVDIEFATQLLQMRHGSDPRVRTTETVVAIDALAAAGHLAREDAEILRDGYAFLRKLEQRIRVVHGTASQLLGERAPGLLPLARRMGIRDRPGAEAAAELLARYRDVTERVRATYEKVVGVAPSPA